MPNLRIVSDNALERAATFTAASTAGALAVTNLLQAKKDSVHRSAGATPLSQTYTATWTTGELIGCVALPYCNLSPTATIRVRAYASNGTTVLYDSGATPVPACPAPALRPRGFTPAQAASAYSNGGGACARHWFSAVTAFKLIVDIADPSNLQGYIEAACMVIGPYWSPQYNAKNAPLTIVDTSKHERTASGSLVTDPGFIYRKVPVELAYMLPADREIFAGLLRNSQAYPILLSVRPGSADLAEERDWTIYGKRSQDSAMALKYAAAYSTTLYVEEL
jgi:hypothetical protein